MLRKTADGYFALRHFRHNIESDFVVAHQGSFLISVILPGIEIALPYIDPRLYLPLFLLSQRDRRFRVARPCGNARLTRKDFPGNPKTSIFGLPSANQRADCFSRSRSSLMQRNSSERRR